jgi:hypothetical protein
MKSVVLTPRGVESGRYSQSCPLTKSFQEHLQTSKMSQTIPETEIKQMASNFFWGAKLALNLKKYKATEK